MIFDPSLYEPKFFILNDDHSLSQVTFDEWVAWSVQNPEAKSIAWTGNQNMYVSTIFMGMDHRLLTDGPPIVFETMAFNGEDILTQKRYCTYADAMDGHRLVVHQYLVRNKNDA